MTTPSLPPMAGVMQMAQTNVPSQTAPASREVKKIQPIDPQQAQHWETTRAIAKYSQVVIDKSDTGLGKSFNAAQLSQEMNGVLLIICPPDVRSTWLKTFEITGVPYYAIDSYNTARPQSDRPVRDYVKAEFDENKKIVRAEVTQKFIDLLTDATNMTGTKRRLIVVFDEYHNAKNAGTGNAVLARTLIQGVRDFNRAQVSNPSIGESARVMLLSATPFDKITHAQNMLKIMGAFSADVLYSSNNQGDIVSTEGFDQLLRYMNALNSNPVLGLRISSANKAWLATLRPGQIYIRSTNQIAYDASSRIIDPAISSYMLGVNHKIIRNRFVKIAYQSQINDPKTGPITVQIKEKIDGVLQEIANAIGFRDADESNSMGKGMLQKLTRLFGELEVSKSPLFQRRGYDILSTVPNSKVIIMLNRLESIGQVANYFLFGEHSAGFRPALIKGETPPIERDEIIARFNEPNNRSRLLICNVNIVKEGRNMHDTDGRFPRYMLISPSYNMISTVQAMGRIDRLGLKSVPFVDFVYTHTATPEIRILSSIMKKGKVLGLHRGQEDLGTEGKSSARKKAKSEQNEEAEEEIADIGSDSNPLPGNYKCNVEDWFDEKKNLVDSSVDEARRYLLKYYGVTPAESIGSMTESGLVPIGVTSARKKPGVRSARKKAGTVDTSTLPTTIKPQIVYQAPVLASFVQQTYIPIQTPQRPNVPAYVAPQTLYQYGLQTGLQQGPPAQPTHIQPAQTPILITAQQTAQQESKYPPAQPENLYSTTNALAPSGIPIQQLATQPLDLPAGLLPAGFLESSGSSRIPTINVAQSNSARI